MSKLAVTVKSISNPGKKDDRMTIQLLDWWFLDHYTPIMKSWIIKYMCGSQSYMEFRNKKSKRRSGKVVFLDLQTALRSYLMRGWLNYQCVGSHHRWHMSWADTYFAKLVAFFQARSMKLKPLELDWAGWTMRPSVILQKYYSFAFDYTDEEEYPSHDTSGPYTKRAKVLLLRQNILILLWKEFRKHGVKNRHFEETYFWPWCIYVLKFLLGKLL